MFATLLFLVSTVVQPVRFRVQNIVDSQGLGIALTGMLVVFTALLLITFFISALPRILTALEDYLPEPHGIGESTSTMTKPMETDHREQFAAAIGLLAHSHAPHLVRRD